MVWIRNIGLLLAVKFASLYATFGEEGTMQVAATSTAPEPHAAGARKLNLVPKKYLQNRNRYQLGNQIASDASEGMKNFRKDKYPSIFTSYCSFFSDTYPSGNRRLILLDGTMHPGGT